VDTKLLVITATAPPSLELHPDASLAPNSHRSKEEAELSQRKRVIRFCAILMAAPAQQMRTLYFHPEVPFFYLSIFLFLVFFLA